VWDIQKVFQRERKKVEVPPPPAETGADKIRLHVKGAIDMHKHMARDDIILKNTLNPHEERFKYIRMTETLSRVPRIPSADISKQIGRYDTE
jgi:hypothetical protein